jgi:hypothetical protein
VSGLIVGLNQPGQTHGFSGTVLAFGQAGNHNLLSFMMAHAGGASGAGIVAVTPSPRQTAQRIA